MYTTSFPYLSSAYNNWNAFTITNLASSEPTEWSASGPIFNYGVDFYEYPNQIRVDVKHTFGNKPFTLKGYIATWASDVDRPIPIDIANIGIINSSAYSLIGPGRFKKYSQFFYKAYTNTASGITPTLKVKILGDLELS